MVILNFNVRHSPFIFVSKAQDQQRKVLNLDSLFLIGSSMLDSSVKILCALTETRQALNHQCSRQLPSPSPSARVDPRQA